MTTYSGLCIDGPWAGKRIVQDRMVWQVEEYPDVRIGAAMLKDNPLTPISYTISVYRHVPGLDVTGVWTIRDRFDKATDLQAYIVECLVKGFESWHAIPGYMRQEIEAASKAKG